MLPTLGLTSTITGTAAPFTVGHAFKKGDVPAGSSVVADFASFQMAAKNVWSDGSLKFALLSGRVDLTANVTRTVTLSIGTPSGGAALTTADLKATGITASMAAGAIGTASWATTDWDTPFQTWVSGPQMSSWLYRKPVGADPHLVAWMEVRLYAGGAVDVLPYMENGYLKVANPTHKNEVFAFTLNGSTRFSERVGPSVYVQTFGGATFTVASTLIGPGPVRVRAGGAGTMEGSATQTSYDGNTGIGTYSVTWDGATPSSMTLVSILGLPHHCRTPLVSGTVLSHWLGTDPQVIPTLDTAYLQSTKLVPKYGTTVPGTSAAVSGLPATFAPLQQGNMPTGMGGAGYHLSIGLLPQWDAAYLTSTAPGVWAAMQRNAYSAGRYGIHFRDETTNRPVRFSQRTTLTLNPAVDVANVSSNIANDITPVPSGNRAPLYTMTHHPSMGTLAYLVTGRFYHLETAQFVATVNYLTNGDQTRGYADGVFKSAAGSCSTRGAAWAVRSLAQAAAITPDADPLSAEFIASARANIAWNHAMYVAQPNNPQGWVRPYTDYSVAAFFNNATTAGSNTITFPAGYVYTSDGYYNGYFIIAGGEERTITAYSGATRTATLSSPFTFTSSSTGIELAQEKVYHEATWQQDFYTAAFGYLKSVNLALAEADAVKLTEFFAWKARSIVGRFGSIASNQYLYRDAAPYTIAVAPSNSADWVTGSGPWYADFGQVWADTVKTVPKILEDGSLRPASLAASSYWGNLQPALAYAKEHGVAGATASDALMRSAPNFSVLQADFANAPEWGVVAGEATATESPGGTMAGIAGYVMDTVSFLVNKYVMDTNRANGILAGDIPTGGTFPHPLAGDPKQGDPAGSRYAYEVKTVPAGLTDWEVYQDGSIRAAGPDGVHTGEKYTKLNGVATLEPMTVNIGVVQPAATITGISISPTTATGAMTFTKNVTGTGSFSNAATFAILSGGGSVNAATGVFTPPAQTGSIQTVVVRVTSTQDASFHADATITIAAAVVSTVSGVTVTPSAPALAGGATQQFNANVSGTNSPSQSVTWATTIGTINPAMGLLTAPAATSSTQNGTVTATSTQDGSKSGSASFTVAAAGIVVPPAPTVSSVTISPSTATIGAYATLQLSALVLGTNLPGQGVTWDSDAGTVVNGLFTPPAATSFAQDVTITATSTVDGSKVGYATITVRASAVNAIVANGNILELAADGSIANPAASNYYLRGRSVFIEKDPDAIMFYGVDLAAYLDRAGNGISLVSVEARPVSVDVSADAAVQGTRLVAQLAGGTNALALSSLDAAPRCTFHFTLSNGDIDEITIWFDITDR